MDDLQPTQNSEPEHSPLGGSSAERWMNCPGSNVILDKLRLPQSDEQDYRRDGSAAHEGAAYCLTHECDTWEIVGHSFNGVEVGPEMADPIQFYLDYVRALQEPGATILVEQAIGSGRRPHPKFYGTVDWSQYGSEILDVVDFKYGEGIVVEPDENPQLMYYAYGIVWNRQQKGVAVRSDRLVRLHIVQPRAFHTDGPIRVWETTAGEIIHWGENELLPAMQRAEIDLTLDPGPWCRFCPAKLFCPLLQSLFGAAAKADPTMLPNFGQGRMGLEYGQIAAVKFYIKAVEEEVFRRNMVGKTVPGTKLVRKKSNRVWKEGALERLIADLGDTAFTKPELKSPPQIEALGPGAKLLVSELAYHPDTGLTVAPENDKRGAVKVEKAADTFAHLIDNATTGEAND